MDGRQDLRDELARLKRRLAEEKGTSNARSSNIGRLLSSRLAHKLNPTQTRKLESAKTGADALVESLHVLEKELNQQQKAARRQFLESLPARAVPLTLLFIVASVLFDAAQYDWVLAGHALFFTTLYIYVYRLVENKYIYPVNPNALNERLLSLLVYMYRWLFFVVFLILEAIVLIDWGLFQPESGQAVIIPFWLGVLAAIYLGLADIQKALSFRFKWPKNLYWRNVVYAIYLLPVVYGLVYIIVITFFVADTLYSYAFLERFLKELATGAVIASTSAALMHVCFVQLKNRMSGV